MPSKPFTVVSLGSTPILYSSISIGNYKKCFHSRSEETTVRLLSTSWPADVPKQHDPKKVFGLNGATCSAYFGLVRNQGINE